MCFCCSCCRNSITLGHAELKMYLCLDAKYQLCVAINKYFPDELVDWPTLSSKRQLQCLHFPFPISESRIQQRCHEMWKSESEVNFLSGSCSVSWILGSNNLLWYLKRPRKLKLVGSSHWSLTSPGSQLEPPPNKICKWFAVPPFSTFPSDCRWEVEGVI